MAPPAEGLHEVTVQYDVRVPVRDGITLSADLFRPVPRREGERFPAILELLPYRKGDWHFRADHQRMTYMAQQGFVGCRVDIRGTGSSPGVALDEYTEQETLDGYDAVEWLAAQPWCNGNVGMWGVSYGGFTSIQVAKLQPPSLRAIFVVYATDDRYTDDVHYIGGCLTGSEFAQYAVSQVGMNAMPPDPTHTTENWAEQWKTRLNRTPPWILPWLRHQTDGPYWRRGSLAPHWDRITCALFQIGGWADGYTSAALRMQERCVNAPRRTIVGPWTHMLPDRAYPGPRLDWLQEMVRFFGHWLRGEDNGVMAEPPLVLFRQEYAPPEPYPAQVPGTWVAEDGFPIARSRQRTLHLGPATLTEQGPSAAGIDVTPHRPTLGTQGNLCWGAGQPPNGLARDLRRDEALSLCYTSAPLEAPLDVIGVPEAVLHLSSTAPVAHVVLRLADVAPDGTSSLVTSGVLNLTHRDGHTHPAPLEPGRRYEVRVGLKGMGYRFRADHRIRLAVATAGWPVVWPSPCPHELSLHRGPEHLSRLVLPEVPLAQDPRPVPALKETPPDLLEVGSGTQEPPQWEIVEDVVRQAVTVRVFGGDRSYLPDHSHLFTSERLEMTASQTNPAAASLSNEVIYQLQEHGYDIEVRATGTIRSTETAFHVDIQLAVTLNGNLFFFRPWLESIPRHLL